MGAIREICGHNLKAEKVRTGFLWPKTCGRNHAHKFLLQNKVLPIIGSQKTAAGYPPG